VGKAKDSPYFVMEFVEGQNLREFIKVRKKMTPKEAMSVAIDVLTGLAYAFEKGMQHRDMKMSNVLISKGRAKLVDFGLAAMSSAKDAEDATTRSIDYAALERASGVKNNDPRSDLYFVGGMIYHMLTGVQPLGESKERSQRLSVSRFQNIRPVTTLEPNLPPAIVLFIARALELDPERRFGSAQEMLDEAQRVLIKVEAYEKAVAAGAEAAEAAEVAAAEMPAEMEGLSRTVMIVESKMEIQDVLRERLKKHGYRVLIFSDPERAIQRFLDSPQTPADCVMFCCPTLGDAALEAFNKFGTLAETKHVPAILFVDGKQGDLVRGALIGAQRVVMAAPLKLRELRQTLLRLLNASLKTKPVA
jgi:serine/threonine-protein kinase